MKTIGKLLLGVLAAPLLCAAILVSPVALVLWMLHQLGAVIVNSTCVRCGRSARVGCSCDLRWGPPG